MSKVTRFIVRGKRRAARLARRIAVQFGVPTDRELVISYLFPPGSETSGFVMAKRIAKWQRPVDVVTHAFPAARQDPGASVVAGSWVRELATVGGEWTTGVCTAAP